MKTPEKIKQGMECCQTDMTTKYKVCGKCGYFNDGFGCENKLLRDALEYIQQLERERDALKEGLKAYGCGTCAYYDVESNEQPCVSCNEDGSRRNWEWDRWNEVE